jgi:hypothetical protein
LAGAADGEGAAGLEAGAAGGFFADGGAGVPARFSLASRFQFLATSGSYEFEPKPIVPFPRALTGRRVKI